MLLRLIENLIFFFLLNYSRDCGVIRIIKKVSTGEKSSQADKKKFCAYFDLFYYGKKVLEIITNVVLQLKKNYHLIEKNI